MIVDTEKMSREADGPYQDGWKRDRPWVRFKNGRRACEEPEDHKRLELYDLETHQKKLGPDYYSKNYGEEKYRAGNSKQEFWEQNWKF